MIAEHKVLCVTAHEIIFHLFSYLILFSLFCLVRRPIFYFIAVEIHWRFVFFSPYLIGTYYDA